MKLRDSGFLIATIGFLILALLGLVLWLVPAKDKVEEQLVAARAELPAIRAERNELSGAPYRQALVSLRGEAKASLQQVQTELKRQAGLVDRWFPRLVLVEGKPARDEFGSTYAFYQDELRRGLRELVRATGNRRMPSIPLRNASFVRGTRSYEADLDVMKADQRAFNLEQLLLKAAAKVGALPYRAMEVREGWEALSDDSAWMEFGVSLFLELPPKSLPALMDQILSLDGEGPVVRIDGVKTRPRTLTAPMAPEDIPLLEVDLRLRLSSYRK